MDMPVYSSARNDTVRGIGRVITCQAMAQRYYPPIPYTDTVLEDAGGGYYGPAGNYKVMCCHFVTCY